MGSRVRRDDMPFCGQRITLLPTHVILPRVCRTFTHAVRDDEEHRADTASIEKGAGSVEIVTVTVVKCYKYGGIGRRIDLGRRQQLGGIVGREIFQQQPQSGLEFFLPRAV